MVSHAPDGPQEAKLDFFFFKNILFSIPPPPPSQYQEWIPEIIYMQKMVSHIQIGLQGAKLEVSVLNMS